MNINVTELMDKSVAHVSKLREELVQYVPTIFSVSA